jgi:curved DNA-binding protein CbpA
VAGETATKRAYETLGIPREANAERIKRSYRKLVKVYPDGSPVNHSVEAATPQIRHSEASKDFLLVDAFREFFKAHVGNGRICFGCPESVT